ncbi:MAG TPA: NAD(P)/FAD-dependent oxidoreductase [bacterium]|nr:NAD(P)/FAD-dependent oxidoreductase [bacterium]
MNTYDVIILGGGAAGLMCASTAASRGRKVLVLEQSRRPSPKILVSGGGRCNFTNIYAKPSNYHSSNPGFVNDALSHFKPKDFIALVKKRGIAYHEKKDGQLFCDKSAKEIIDLLVDRAKNSGANLLLDQKVQQVSHDNSTFTIQVEGQTYQSSRLVVATGGLSWPQLGASDFGYKIAQQFGMKIMEPSPALVGLNFQPEDLARFKDLAGIHLNVAASCGPWNMVEDIMITHTGLSGPIMLNASLVWEPGKEIVINWIPEMNTKETYDQLKKDKAAGGRGEFRIWFSERVPRRLAERIAWNAGARGAWAELPDEILMALAKSIHEYRFIPQDTFGYRMAEVTKGGVDTREFSPQTMESLKVPGLFFIGEVLDVTGQLGGFNFQWAWASGWASGQAV